MSLFGLLSLFLEWWNIFKWRMVLDQVSPDGCRILNCRIHLQETPGNEIISISASEGTCFWRYFAVFRFEALYKWECCWQGDSVSVLSCNEASAATGSFSGLFAPSIGERLSKLLAEVCKCVLWDHLSAISANNASNRSSPHFFFHHFLLISYIFH